MGQVPSATQDHGSPAVAQLTADELHAHMAHTRYTADEILRLHAQFTLDATTGCIPYSAFRANLFFYGVLSEDVGNMLFRVFDANADGMIDFGEFVRAMSVMTRGTDEEKLLLAFRMYDVDRTGIVRRGNMRALAAALRDTFGELRAHRQPDATPDEVVAALFDAVPSAAWGAGRSSAIPVDDQTLSYAEWVLTATSSPGVVRGLALHTPSPVSAGGAPLYPYPPCVRTSTSTSTAEYGISFCTSLSSSNRSFLSSSCFPSFATP